MTCPAAPRSLCLLRLSALGDVTHVLPLVRTLQRAWPQLPITWIIGKGEAKLLEGLDGVELLVFDKKAGLAGMRALRRQLAGRRFDVLLQMQLALRANLLSALVRAERRIGYDRARSKEGHGLFINERIPPGGHPRARCLRQLLRAAGPGAGPTWSGTCRCRTRRATGPPRSCRATHADPADLALLQPCTAQLVRRRVTPPSPTTPRRKGWRIVLCGGRSELERDTGDAILAAMQPRRST